VTLITRVTKETNRFHEETPMSPSKGSALIIGASSGIGAAYADRPAAVVMISSSSRAAATGLKTSRRACARRT
jgi:NAD(P)-dependent dehydrogenase (short-subunit alcohol dehydrogenase family)